MPSDSRDYKLDLTSAGRDAVGGKASSAEARGRRSSVGQPYLSVHFACCGSYQRIYRDPDGTQYHGRCPRCGRPVRFGVGPGGTSVRSFVVA